LPLPRLIRALQVNLEDPFGFYSEELDADRIVELAERVRANTVIVFARDAWGRVFYQGSRLYPRHPRSSLDVAELSRKLRERGIAFVPMAVHTANRHVYRLHPSWAQRNIDDEVIVLENIPLEERVRDPHWPQICPNSPAMEKYFIPEIMEVVEKTQPDAVHLDSFRYLPDLTKACYCPYCRARFREETGFDLPRRANAEDEAYRLAWEWRYSVNVTSIARLREAAKRVKKDIALFYNSHPAGWAGRGNRIVELARDYLDAVYAEGTEADSRGPGFLTFITKLSRGMIGWDPDKRVLTTRNLFFFLRVPQSPPAPTIRQGIREILAAGGEPVAVTFASQLFTDPRALDAVAEVYEEIDRLEDYLTRRRPLNYLAIAYSTFTHDWMLHPRPEYYIGEVMGFALIAMHRHLPWSIIADPELEDQAALARFRALVAASLGVVSDEVEESIRVWIQEGGTLLATHQFGYMRPDFTYRHSLALNDVLGVCFEGVQKLGYLYYDLEAAGAYNTVWKGMSRLIPFGDHSTAFRRDRRDPMLGENVKVATSPRCSERVKVLASIRLARRAWGYEYTLGRSTPPPGPLTEMPGIIEASYGGGAAVYYTVRLGLHYDRLGHPDYAELVMRPLLVHAGEPPAWAEAPDTVQFEPYRLEGGGYLIHLVNHTYNQKFLDAPIGAARQPLPPFDPAYSIHPIRRVISVPEATIHLRVEHGSYLVRRLVEGSEERVRVENGILKYKIRGIGEHEIVAVEPSA
jgi:hypothetical protein